MKIDEPPVTVDIKAGRPPYDSLELQDLTNAVKLINYCCNQHDLGVSCVYIDSRMMGCEIPLILDKSIIRRAYKFGLISERQYKPLRKLAPWDFEKFYD